MNKTFRQVLRHAFGRRRETILQSESEPKEIRKLVNWSRVMLTGHTALAVVFVLLGNWILLLLVTFASFTAGWYTLFTHMPQHSGMRPDVLDWRQSTRTYLAGPIVRFFYWNMNYHVEHHMYAAVPFYNLPKLRKAIEADVLIASKGLIATWREIFATQKKQKKHPEYCFLPKLPKSANPYLPVGDREPRPV